jgi:hypothetical protein
VAIAAVAAGLLVVLAIVAGVGQPTPSASPTPAAAVPSATVTPSPARTAPTPTPSGTTAASGIPSASPGPAGSARYGYLAVGGGGFALVDEAGATIQQFGCGGAGRGCSQTMIAVSPDGRRVAYWRTGQEPRWEVRVFEVATPASPRTVAMLPDDFEGLSLAWATDSRGLLFAAQTVGYGGIQGGAGKATISGVDATTAGPATDVLPTRTDGAFYRPLVWDRSRNIVAAVTSGEGGFVLEYAVKVGDRYTATRASPGQMVAFQIEASPDGTRVLGVDMSSNTLQIWPVADFGARAKANPGTNVPRISGALWRTSNEVAWSYGDRLDVFIPQSDATRTVYTASGVRLVAIRPDGTAALVASGGQPNVSTVLLVVDVQTGAVTSRTTMDVAQVVVPRGVLLR